MMKQRRKGLFLFVCSCVPGCGQMYQGYMKRGLSLMLLFWGWMAMIVFLQIDALIFLLVPMWLYTYFDSYNLRARMDQEGSGGEDDAFLFGLSDVDSEKFTAICAKRHSLIGWLLVALGLYMLYDRIVRRLASFLWQFEHLDWLYNLLVYDVPRLIVTFGIIALGLWFIRGPKKAAPVEEIPVFTPPAAEAAAEEEAEEKEAEHGEV